MIVLVLNDIIIMLGINEHLLQSCCYQHKLMKSKIPYVKYFTYYYCYHHNYYVNYLTCEL